MNSRRTYYALSLDLVGSRTLPRRPAFARRLARTLILIRRRFRAEWLAPLVSAHGIDELSGVLKRPQSTLEVLAVLNRAVAPARYRMGLGVGRIDVDMRRGDAAGMDGTAFLHAAIAVRRARALGIAFALECPGASPRTIAQLSALSADSLTITPPAHPSRGKSRPRTRSRRS